MVFCLTNAKRQSREFTRFRWEKAIDLMCCENEKSVKLQFKIRFVCCVPRLCAFFRARRVGALLKVPASDLRGSCNVALNYSEIVRVRLGGVVFAVGAIMGKRVTHFLRRSRARFCSSIDINNRSPRESAFRTGRRENSLQREGGGLMRNVYVLRLNPYGNAQSFAALRSTRCRTGAACLFPSRSGRPFGCRLLQRLPANSTRKIARVPSAPRQALNTAHRAVAAAQRMSRSVTRFETSGVSGLVRRPHRMSLAAPVRSCGLGASARRFSCTVRRRLYVQASVRQWEYRRRSRCRSSRIDDAGRGG